MTHVPLHVHSGFSFGRAAVRVEDLVPAAASLGLPAIALTDSDGLYGIPRLVRVCRAAGVQPIVGVEVTMEDSHPVVLLARNRSGYSALCRLVTGLHLDSDKTPGRLAHADLAAASADLIGLSAGPEGAAWAALARSGPDAARSVLARQAAAFPSGAFCVEISPQTPDDAGWDALHGLARSLGLPVVLTAPVRYLAPGDRVLLDTLVKARRGRPLPGAWHLRDADEMRALASRFPGAVERTLEVADRCRFEFPSASAGWPEDEQTRAQPVLTDIARRGLESRLGSGITAEHRERLARELATVADTRLAPYFLLLAEISGHLQRKRILAVGVGSAGDSLLCYALGIAHVDPVPLGLLFERFLHPLRRELPDVDFEIDSTRRDEVIGHLLKRHGDAAAMVCTVNTLEAKSAVRLVGEAAGLRPEEVGRITRALHDVPVRELTDAVETLPELSFLRGARYGPFLRLAERVGRLPTHLSVHPGGVVLGSGPLAENVPLQRAAKGVLITQYDKDDLPSLGLVKIDLLGSRALAAIGTTLEIVRATEGRSLSLDGIPLDDEATYQRMRTGETIGVFQLETPGMRETLGRIQPRGFSDVVATVTLFRPGPLQGNLIARYVARREGRRPASPPHPLLEPVVRDSLGLLMFQEQILAAASLVGGLSLAEADELRRAMTGKATDEVLEPVRERFVFGARERGLRDDEADRVFRQMAAFARYGFNQAHAVAFAHLAYVACYLREHFPLEYFTALATLGAVGFYPPRIIIAEARRAAVAVDLPHVNESHLRPSIRAGRLRLGLEGIAYLGKAAAAIVRVRASRPYQSVWDLVARVAIAAQGLEHLVAVGACDGLGETRPRMLLEAERALALRRQKRLTPENAAEVARVEGAAPPHPAEFDLRQKVRAELLGLGLAVSGHPLQFYRASLAEAGVLTAEDLWLQADHAEVAVAGTYVTRQTPAGGERILYVTIDDETGLADLVVPRDAQEAFGRAIDQGPGIVAWGRIRRRGRGQRVVVGDVRPLTDVAARAGR